MKQKLSDWLLRPVVPMDKLMSGEGDRVALTKMTRLGDGSGFAEQRNGGRAVYPLDDDQKIIAEEICNGWMFISVRFIRSLENSARPDETDRTGILHQKNRATQDVANKHNQIVLLPQLMLSLMHKYGAAGRRMEDAATQKFLSEILFQNGFLPDDVQQMSLLHDALEKYAIRTVVSRRPEEHGLHRFRSISPFTHVRMETEPGSVHDGMDEYSKIPHMEDAN